MAVNRENTGINGVWAEKQWCYRSFTEKNGINGNHLETSCVSGIYQEK